ncbi:MAG: hypothetical protein LC122_12295 [Chitinophagales bacterium]|nr:hypothetical protein [Chitinophagales bacterium]
MNDIDNFINLKYNKYLKNNIEEIIITKNDDVIKLIGKPIILGHIDKVKQVLNYINIKNFNIVETQFKNFVYCEINENFLKER